MSKRPGTGGLIFRWLCAAACVGWDSYRLLVKHMNLKWWDIGLTVVVVAFAVVSTVQFVSEGK
jgi:hypothetical protein